VLPPVCGASARSDYYFLTGKTTASRRLVSASFQIFSRGGGKGGGRQPPGDEGLFDESILLMESGDAGDVWCACSDSAQSGTVHADCLES